MKATRIITIICWCISALALTGLVLWILFASPFVGSVGNWRFIDFNLNLGGMESLSGPFEPVGTHRVSDISDIDSLDIDWVSGTINIKPHDGNEIVITEFAQRALYDNEKMSVSTHDNTLRIEYIEGNRIGRMPTKHLEVLIPQSLSSDMKRLVVDATSGRITLYDISAQIIYLNATSGGFDLSNVIADLITLDGTSGSVNISNSSSTELRIDITSGSQNISGSFDSIYIDGTSGRLTVNNDAPSSSISVSVTSGSQDITGSFSYVNLSCTSGSITIVSREVPESLRISNTSGNINITIPNEGTVSLHHSSTSGRFSSDVPVIMQGRSDAMWRISSTSGNLNINELR